MGEGGNKKKKQSAKERRGGREGRRKERKESTGGGGGSQEQEREKRDRRQARLKHLKKRERDREGAQEDKGRVLMIKGRPHGKQKIQSLSPQLNSNQIQQ